MANLITGSRIVFSILLLFCTPFSPAFYVLYLTAGLTDMVDGAVARKTGTVSEFGLKLDTIADIVFTTICLIKLLPIMEVPAWLYIWISFIAMIKLLNIAIGYIKQNAFAAVHSIINKLTGCLMFIFPVTLEFIDLKYSAAVVCFIATVAAIHESNTVLCKTF